MRVLFCLICVLLAACVPANKRTSVPPENAPRQTLTDYATPTPPAASPSAAGAELPRAAPAYTQWLERQSMLGTAPQLTTLVSGTERLLSASSISSADRIDTLLSAADAWLWLHPPTLLTAQMRPVWTEAAALAPVMDGLGLRGLYIAPVQESGSIWGNNRKRSDTGEDTTSLTDASHMGGDADFAALAQVAAQRGWQLGTDIVNPATGMGPDFFLTAQTVREYNGIYIMMDAPESLWPALPQATESWEGLPLDTAQTAPLVEAGIIPPALARDSLDWAGSKAGGWAVTGPVRGNDGRIRRFIYRYDTEPRRPVLAWDDPSGTARRILSASVIRETGVRQHTLVGIHIAPFVGLDASKESVSVGAGTLEPAPSALRDIGREVRRYGGWSVQRDTLPAPAGNNSEGADFTADTVTSPAAEYAVITGNAGPLRAALAASMNNERSGIDHRRLVRSLSDPAGVALGKFADAPLREQVQKSGWGSLLHNGHLYATAPTIAAIGAGLTPDAATRTVQAVQRRHILLTLWRAGLPGLLFIAGQDIAGVLSLPDGPAHIRARGAYSLNVAAASSLSTRQGTARAPVAYPPVDEQLRTAHSYTGQVRAALALRRQLGLAHGTLHSTARTSHAGSAGVFIKTTNGIVLIIANFSDKAVTENMPSPRGNMRVDLAPLECKWVQLR